MSKIELLEKLTAKRRNTLLKGYCNIHDFHDGIYDCNYVSPYTQSAHNVESDIFVLLQDWASEDFLRDNNDENLINLGHDPKLPTNKNLKKFLHTHLGLALSDTYATNLFPFVKPADMSARIPNKALDFAAECFALPQIEIICPKLVIALGLPTFNSMRRVTGHKAITPSAEAIASPFYINDVRIFCQAHTGALGQANRNRGGQNRVDGDWAEMSNWYNNICEMNYPYKEQVVY